MGLGGMGGQGRSLLGSRGGGNEEEEEEEDDGSLRSAMSSDPLTGL